MAAHLLLFTPALLQAAEPRPEILVVLSYHVGMPWTDEVSKGLIDSLDGVAEPVFTQLDVKRHPEVAEEAQLAVVAAKADMAAPRVIVAIDDYAYQFVLRHRARLGPEVPIVFGGVNYFAGTPPPHVTGVVESVDFEKTLDLIEALQPDARRWIVVNDPSETGASNRQALEPVLARRARHAVRWIGSGTFAETEEEIATLDPRQDAVLLLSWNLDSRGQTRSYAEAVARAHALSPAPAYGVWNFYFGNGIVGGALLDGHVHGREIGALVRRILAGEPAGAIPVVDQCRTSLRVDAREMARHGLDLDRVLPGTEIAFLTPGLWAQHGLKIAVFLAVLVLQSATITWLLIARRHRKQALRRLRDGKEALRLALDRLESAQQVASIGSWELDHTRTNVTLSREMYRLVDLEPGSRPPLHNEILARFHPDDRGTIEATMDRVEASGIPATIEVRSDPARGHPRIFRVTIQTRMQATANKSFLSGTLQDITAQTTVEAAARASHERASLALEGAALGIWDWHLPTGAITFNDRCIAMAGYTRAQAGTDPRHWAAHVHPEDLTSVSALVADYRAGRITEHETEFRIRHADGTWIPVLSKGKVIERAPDGTPLRAAGTHLDMSVLRRREEALRSTERKLAEIFRASPEVIALTRASDGRFLEINEAFTRIFGYTHSEVVGRTSVELNLWPEPADRARLLQLITARGEIRNKEVQFRDKSGRLVPFQVSVVPLKIEGESCLIWLLTDISEIKRADAERASLQEQLLHAMKMEAVGRLAGGVAHDFNNLLTVISGNIDLIRADLDPASPLAPYLAEVGTAAGSAAGLTRQLLAFSRRQIIEPKVVDLNELLRNLRKMLARLIGEDIALELRLAERLGAVKFDPGQFEQVVVNLTVNARDAMPSGGCLTISTSHVEIASPGKNSKISPGTYVALTVTDTGHGMSAEVKQRLFEPFFTTKPVGRGTGLGLAMAFGVIEQAGGAIDVESEVGRGTTFRILLPRVDGPMVNLDHAVPWAELPRGSETVLVVEDDKSVRAIASAVLKRLGYQVLVAADGYDAINQARTATTPIHLVVTDLVMPGIGGRETAEKIRLIHPHIAVLYTSGYTEDAVLRQGIMTDTVAFISKPYTLQGIAVKVREVIASFHRESPSAVPDASRSPGRRDTPGIG